MKRRDFLKYQLHGALWLAAGASGLVSAESLFAETAPDVAVVKGAPGAATRAAVELLGGMKAFVKPGQRVVIKPNMSFPHPVERGSNTHPEVVTTLAAMCKEAGASRVLVLDHPLSSAERCLEQSGIREACQAIEDDMVHAFTSPSFYREADIPKGEDMKRNQVMRDVLEADVLIAAPTAKSHSSAGVSLSLKGMMGLILDRGVMHGRHELDEAIVDLASLLKADLTVIDSSYVLTTGGPSGPGKVVKADTVIASRDMVAADATCVASFEWYGRTFKPQQVNHIRRAAERGLGRLDIEKLRTRTLTL
ncbi:MAG: DUF362 domain-containing protein [Desulfocurvibacter africanus]